MQGNDPSTDLRGVGFLGLVQPLYLVSSSAKTLQLAKDIYHLSQNETQEFPLMVLSINVTRIAVCALRDSLLARYVPTFLKNVLYTALVLSAGSPRRENSGILAFSFPGH